MKKEFKSLKDMYYEYKMLSETFKGQRFSFQWCVAFQKDTLDIEEIIIDGKDTYEKAKRFEQYYPNIAKMDNQIKEKYPNCSLEERMYVIKQLFKEELTFVNNLDMSKVDACFYFYLVVDNYYLYESCDFSNLKQLEEKLLQLKQQMNDKFMDMLDESKDTAQQIGIATIDKVKPYSTAVKKGFKEVKKTTKGVVNKGSKKLIKVLDKVEERTR